MIWPENLDLLEKMSSFLHRTLSLPEDATLSELLQKKVFSLSKGRKTKWSLLDFFQNPSESFKDKRFSVGEHFFEISRQVLEANSKAFTLLRIVDVTVEVKLALETGKQTILQMINAMVSHEMRNPINAVISQTLKITELAKRLERVSSGVCEEMQKVLVEIIDQLGSCN